MESLTTEAYKKVIGSRENLYEVVFRNGFILPKMTASICTESYLNKVADGSIYAPKELELKYR